MARRQRSRRLCTCGGSWAVGFLRTTARASSESGVVRDRCRLRVGSRLTRWLEMARRIDYLDDPSAPKATSLVPSVNVGVLNDKGELLLIRRTDNENWAMPGGAMDIGETIAEAGVRETREETGIEC